MRLGCIKVRPSPTEEIRRLRACLLSQRMELRVEGAFISRSIRATGSIADGLVLAL